jgi:hypothetical protein
VCVRLVVPGRAHIWNSSPAPENNKRLLLYYYDYFDSWVVVGERRSSPRRLKDKFKRVSCIVHVYVPQHEKREIWKNFILGPPPLKTKAKWE